MENVQWEWEPWLYEFKKIYGNGTKVVTSYESLKYLLELWHQDVSPSTAVEMVRRLVASHPGPADSVTTG